MEYIKTIDLKKNQVPQSNAAIGLINAFALTFEIEEVQNSILSVSLDSNLANLSIAQLRYVLYCEQRRWNHFGRDYDIETERKIRLVIELIKAKAF